MSVFRGTGQEQGFGFFVRQKDLKTTMFSSQK